jgi:hypothetical protein
MKVKKQQREDGVFESLQAGNESNDVTLNTSLQFLFLFEASSADPRSFLKCKT